MTDDNLGAPTSAPSWIASGEVEHVDPAAGTITLWMGWPDLQTTAIVPAMPRWLLFPGTSFSVAIPRRCADEQTLDDVGWGQFTTNGMDVEPEQDTYWRAGQVYTDPAGRRQKYGFAPPGPRALHNMAVRMLCCQDECACLARELMDVVPAGADSLQEMVQAYARELSPLLASEGAERSDGNDGEEP